MGTIIIAMPRVEDSNHLADMIKSRGLLHDIEICRNSSEVLRYANERDYGIVVCTGKISEMGYIELHGYLPDMFGMIILTKNMTLETVSDRMMKLNMPLKPSEFIATLEMVGSILGRNLRKKKKAPPRRSQAEQKIIDEAKGLLMNRNGMTEPEAFRYIQKCSMDTGRSMLESAQMILLM